MGFKELFSRSWLSKRQQKRPKIDWAGSCHSPELGHVPVRGRMRASRTRVERKVYSSNRYFVHQHLDIRQRILTVVKVREVIKSMYALVWTDGQFQKLAMQLGPRRVTAMTDFEPSDSTANILRQRKPSSADTSGLTTPLVSSEAPEEVVWGKTPSGQGEALPSFHFHCMGHTTNAQSLHLPSIQGPCHSFLRSYHLTHNHDLISHRVDYPITLVPIRALLLPPSFVPRSGVLSLLCILAREL